VQGVVLFGFCWLGFGKWNDTLLMNNLQTKQKDRHKRPPLSVRCSVAETVLIDCAAAQLGTSRAALFRRSALSLVRQLQQEGALTTTNGGFGLVDAA
jgi:hypothetical protein